MSCWNIQACCFSRRPQILPPMPRRAPSLPTRQPFQVFSPHSRAETQLPFEQICLEIKCYVWITLLLLTLNTRHQCRCKEGFALRGGECKAMDCPALLPPAHGYFLRNECKNVFNAACGVRCQSGYQVHLCVSLTYVTPLPAIWLWHPTVPTLRCMEWRASRVQS